MLTPAVDALAPLPMSNARVPCRPLAARPWRRLAAPPQVIDEKIVVVLDPADTVGQKKDYLDAKRSMERRYVFDIAMEGTCTNSDCYQRTVAEQTGTILNGLNSTVFAYGATGSGKTHTMVGSHDDPGLMVLALKDVFRKLADAPSGYEWDVKCSYIEVYNELIHDLLDPHASKQHSLELRENPGEGVTIAGVTKVNVDSAETILDLLRQGNSRRKTEATDANATSSRSHAVLTISVARTEANKYRAKVLNGKLSLVDLAGSERASETNNRGKALHDGANINRSLLALANCINALGKQHKKGMAYVPYRNSKLTRLLKDGLSGNSRTAMIATVSCSSDQYHHTTNTLKYADRAKEIKTHVQTNIGTVESHISDYQRMIDNLQKEVYQLKTELKSKEGIARPVPAPGMAGGEDESELTWLDALSNDINVNVEARINLQKALFELEDTNVQNKSDLTQLDEQLTEAARSTGGQLPTTAAELAELRERREDMAENVRENEETGERIRAEIESNEAHRRSLQAKIDTAMKSDRNKTFLHILSQYRLQGVMNMELQLQMAVRDQIIEDQKEVIGNLWRVLECSGLDRERILEIAQEQGIGIQVEPDGGDASELEPSGPIAVGAAGARAVARHEMLDPGAAGGRHKKTPSMGGVVATSPIETPTSPVQEPKKPRPESSPGKARRALASGGTGVQEPKHPRPESSPGKARRALASGGKGGRPASAASVRASGGENVPPSGGQSGGQGGGQGGGKGSGKGGADVSTARTVGSSSSLGSHGRSAGASNRQRLGVSVAVPDLMVVNGSNGGGRGEAAPRGGGRRFASVRGVAPLARRFASVRGVAPLAPRGGPAAPQRLKALSILKGSRSKSNAGRARAGVHGHVHEAPPAGTPRRRPDSNR